MTKLCLSVRIASLLALAFGVADTGFAKLKWDEVVISRTAEVGDNDVSVSFSFVNSGEKPVTIRDVSTGCECTVATMERHTFAPGEHGEIKVTYFVADRTGAQQREIFVHTDDPADPQERLTLKVEIAELLTLSTRMVLWRINEPATMKTIDLRAARESKIVSLVATVSDESALDTAIEALSSGSHYRLQLKPNKTVKEMTTRITLSAMFANGKQCSFHAYALVR